LSVIRPMSSLLTILLVSLLQCVKVDTLGTPCKENLDQAYHSFKQSYLNYHAKFLYFLFNILILDISPITNGHLLICDWCFRILKGSKIQSLDSDKDVVKSEV